MEYGLALWNLLCSLYVINLSCEALVLLLACNLGIPATPIAILMRAEGNRPTLTYLHESSKDSHLGYQDSHDGRGQAGHELEEPVNMGTEMRQSLRRHDIEKGAIAIAHVETLLPAPERVLYNDVFGCGAKGDIHTHGLTILCPPAHPPEEVFQRSVDDGLQPAHVLPREVRVQGRAAVAVQVVILR